MGGDYAVFSLDILHGNGKELFVSRAERRLTAEFSGTCTWPGERGTQLFGANPPRGRACCLLSEPFS